MENYTHTNMQEETYMSVFSNPSYKLSRCTGYEYTSQSTSYISHSIFHLISISSSHPIHIEFCNVFCDKEQTNERDEEIEQVTYETFTFLYLFVRSFVISMVFISLSLFFIPFFFFLGRSLPFYTQNRAVSSFQANTMR